jgi:CYTH domain-containing protein
MPGRGRYAEREREQRWLLDGIPAGSADPVEIHDLYVHDTQLRLRRIESPDEVIWKLGQKIRLRPDSPEIVKMTNFYLDEREYLVLLQLEGDPLRKTRWHWVWTEHQLSIDVFGGHLEGLVLAEVELGPEEPLLESPVGARLDVTQDDRFSGGALARSTPDEARLLLRESLA